MSQSDFAFQFKTFDVELAFAKRLREHRKRVFDGITTLEITKERIRQAIIDSKIDCTIFGRAPNGRPETYAASFQRFYGTPLHEPKTVARSANRKAVRTTHSAGSGKKSDEKGTVDENTSARQMPVRDGNDGGA